MKDALIGYAVASWNSGRLFDKGKIIFIGFIVLFLLIKIIYSIFV